MSASCSKTRSSFNSLALVPHLEYVRSHSSGKPNCLGCLSTQAASLTYHGQLATVCPGPDHCQALWAQGYPVGCTLSPQQELWDPQMSKLQPGGSVHGSQTPWGPADRQRLRSPKGVDQQLPRCRKHSPAGGEPFDSHRSPLVPAFH